MSEMLMKLLQDFLELGAGCFKWTILPEKCCKYFIEFPHSALKCFGKKFKGVQAPGSIFAAIQFSRVNVERLRYTGKKKKTIKKVEAEVIILLLFCFFLPDILTGLGLSVLKKSIPTI